MRPKWAMVTVAVCVVVTVVAVAYAAAKATADVPEVIRAQRFELVDEEGEVRAVLALVPDLGATLKLTGRSGTRAWLSGQYRVHLYDESGNTRAELSHMGLRVHMPIRAWATAEEAWWEARDARQERVPDATVDSSPRARWEGRGDQWATLGFFLGTHGPHLGPHLSLSDSTADRGEL